MPSLGDAFNDQFKEDFARRNIDVGYVVKCFVDCTKPPKEKRFVILGKDSGEHLIGAVFINSNLNWKMIPTMKIAQLQHYIYAEDNECITKDCYIDCSEIYEIPYDIVLKSIISKPENALGILKKEDMDTVFNFVKQSPKITPKILKRYNL